MKLFKKLLAVVLLVSMLLSISFTAAATEATENTQNKDSDISDMLNLGNRNPLPDNVTEPFNAAPDSNILMTKENELLLYTSNKKGASTKDDFAAVFEKMKQDTSYKVDGNIFPELDLFFVTAVALNASGNGTDDHVAYLGVKAFDKNDGANAKRAGEQVLMLVLYNARKKTTVATLELGSVKSWIGNLEQYAYKTFFSVTAGDYDEDGIDEIACTDHNMGVQLVEINAENPAALTLSKGRRYDWAELVSGSVAEKMKKTVTASGDIRRRALISLTTGNFDGTGAEELATAVSTNHPGDDIFLPDIPEAYTTQLAMVWSPLSDSANITNLVVHSKEASEDEEEQDNVVHRVIYAGQITAGDVDADRRDEVVIAGYTGKIEVTAKGQFVDGRYEYDTENIALCYADIDEDWVGIPAITVDAMTPFIAEGFFDDEDYARVPLSVDAAKLHGQYGKESVFVGGKVYQFSSEEATVLYTHAFFEEESSWTITDAYVEHVTSGVFGGPDTLNDNKPMINEQFVFTVVEKDNSQNDYSYKVGFISVSTNLETNAVSFADNTQTMNSDDYLLDECPGGELDGSDTDYGTALVPVAVDIDDDGMLVKHTNTTYFYEDPSVEAVLQAAPYFDELGGWNEFNGSTTYSVSVSRSLIDVWGYSHSIHTGVKGKFEGGVGELEFKVGYALDMDFAHEKAYTNTYTTTFEAGSYDTVVVQRTPYICYEYSYVDINGNLLTGEDAGSVVLMEAMQPVYFQLSVEEYNQFVDEYNALADRHDSQGKNANGEPVEVVGDSYRLVKITDDILPSNTMGNPENYRDSIRDGAYISQGTYALGHNGGYTTSEFSYEVEQTYTATYAHGAHIEIEGTAKTAAAVFSIGGFAETSFQETCGYGDATINGTGTGGTVANIIPSNYSEVEKKTLKLYGFNWRCAMWKRSLMTDAEGNPYLDSEGNEFLIPIVGYVVTNVKSPMAAPSGVNAYLSDAGNQVKVEWIPSPNDTGALLGYFIYRICDDQEPVQVNPTMLSAETASFVDFSTLNSGKIYTYYVVACYDDGSAKYATMNSKASSVVWGIPQMSGSKFIGSMFGNGSLMMAMTMVSMGIAAASLGITMAGKKKSAAERAKTEAQADPDSSEND